MTAGLLVYRIATELAAPLMPFWLSRRESRGKEDVANRQHRFARELPSRPSDLCLWCHGASIGESLMLADLVRQIRQTRPDIAVLCTAQTISALQVLRPRLSESDLALIAPLDIKRVARRFVDHFRPDLALFAESEIWPHLLLACDEHAIPRGQINARLSKKSQKGWQKWPGTIRRLMSGFAFITASDPETSKQCLDWGGRVRAPAANLKSALALTNQSSSPIELFNLDRWKAGRRCILAASTHKGEEQSVLRAYSELDPAQHCLIIAPRHPERRAEILDLARQTGLETASRSLDEYPSPNSVYIADTIGEMPRFYVMADLTYLGGGHAAGIGGHNPMESLCAGVPVITGPDTENMEPLMSKLEAAGFIGRVELANLGKTIGLDYPTVELSALKACLSDDLEVLEVAITAIDALLPAPTKEHLS